MSVSTNVTALGNLIKGRSIIIPDIQRAYSWKTGDTSTQDSSDASATALLEDLQSYHELVISGIEYRYYLGSLIICVDENKEINSPKVTWELLDGQQRITSLTLLFIEIYKILQLEDDKDSVQLCKRIVKDWLGLDLDNFDTPEPDWGFTLYPRRENDRIALKHICNFEPLENLHNSPIKDVVSLYETELKKYDLRNLQEFLTTILDRVLVSVIITNESTMAYQMFQTANARGTPLNSLDLFRSTVIKRIKTELQATKKDIDLIKSTLDQIETFIGYTAGEKEIRLKISKLNNSAKEELNKLDSEAKNKLSQKERSNRINQDLIQDGNKLQKDLSKKKEEITRRLMLAWVGCRTGKIESKGLLAYINKIINRCKDKNELLSIVEDLRNHSFTWWMNIESPILKITEKNRFQPIFNIVKHQWKWLGISIYNNNFHAEIEFRLSKKQQNAIINMQVWWSLLSFAQTGKVNTTAFREWAKEANMIWQHGKTSPDGKNIIWNEDAFAKRITNRLADMNFESLINKFTIIPSGTSNSNFRKLKAARAILAVYELNIPHGLGPISHLKGSNQAHMSPLFTRDEIGDEYFTLGNWFLIRGSNNEGINQQTRNKTLKGSQSDRISMIKKYASFASHKDIEPGSNAGRKFVKKRTLDIRINLELKLQEFKIRGWPEKKKVI